MFRVEVLLKELTTCLSLIFCSLWQILFQDCLIFICILLPIYTVQPSCHCRNNIIREWWRMLPPPGFTRFIVLFFFSPTRSILYVGQKFSVLLSPDHMHIPSHACSVFWHDLWKSAYRISFGLISAMTLLLQIHPKRTDLWCALLTDVLWKDCPTWFVALNTSSR